MIALFLIHFRKVIQKRYYKWKISITYEVSKNSIPYTYRKLFILREYTDGFFHRDNF